MNNDFELPEDFFKTFEKTLDLLRRGNLTLLRKGQSTFKKLWRFLYIMPGCVGLFLSMAVFVIKIISKGDDYYEIANCLPLIFIILHGTIKGLVILFNDEKINDIFVKLGALWPKNDELTDSQLATKSHLLGRVSTFITIHYWVNIIAAIQYLSSPCAEMGLRKYILKQDTPFILPFGYSYPYNATETLSVYTATYAFEVLTITKMVDYVVGCELLLITMTAHISNIFTLLQEDVLNMKVISNKNQPSDPKDDDVSLATDDRNQKTLKDVVIKHQKLIELTKKFDNIFNVVVFVNLLIASVLLCFFGFVAKVARGPTDMARNMVGVIASIVPVISLCYYGQQLEDASEGLAHSAYSSLWYEGSPQYQKMLCILIFRSQHPPCITNLGVAPVTLNTFTKVMSTTYSYFNLVNSQYEAQ